MANVRHKEQRIRPTEEDLLRSASSQEVLLWETQDGTFKGWEDDGVNRAQGIRYATSTRYEEPRPFSYGDGVHEAIAPPPVSYQPHSKIDFQLSNTNYGLIEKIEDCQFLSITLPKETRPGDKLPVMVWIHGGSFKTGGIDTLAYDMESIVKEERVIVVAIAYRLGALGFLQNRQGELANLGLLDQIEALRWVHRNIDDFGGDPTNVTLFGESAGATSVQHLMICEGVEDLFHHVIIQSAPMGVMNHREAMMAYFLEGFKELPLDAPIKDILHKQSALSKGCKEKSPAKYMYFGPHYGVHPLPPKADLEEAWKKAANRYDILVGTNTREIAIYGFNNRLVMVLKDFPLAKQIIEGLVSYYTKKIFSTDTKDFVKTCAKGKGRLYYYECSWGAQKAFIGACHGMELTLLFGAHRFGNSPLLMGMNPDEIDRYGKVLRAIWGEFARTGQVTTYEIDEVITIKDMRKAPTNP